MLMPCLLTLSVALAAPPEPMVGPPPNLPPKLVPLPTPSDAQAAALADLKAMPAGDRVFTRYLWIADGKKESAQLGSLTLNYVSRSGTIHRPPVIAKGMLLRVDLRWFAPIVTDLAEWIALWELLSTDPSFNTLITRDQIAQEIKRGQVFADVVGVGTRKIRVRCKPYKVDGVEFDSKFVAVIRLTGRHLDAKVAGELEQLTGSLAPVVESRLFTFRVLSTIKDKNPVFQAVYSGLYYEFAAIRKAKDLGKKAGVTDEDVLFEKVGLGDIDRGLTAAVLFERLRSDRRTVMQESLVTKKKRRVDLFPILTDVGGVLLITHDINDDDVDIGTDPIKNLAVFIDRAREDIFTLQNGLHGFALFDGNGALQDQAPDTVVRDHEIPAPNTNRLAGAISCIRCHNKFGDDGLRPLRNDVLTLLRAYKDRNLDIFGDVSKENLNRAIPDTLDRLARQYTWNPEETLSVARRNYIKAILLATGPWEADKGAQVDIAKFTGLAYESLWQTFWYDSVDARIALIDMGYGGVAGKDATDLFKKLLPPDTGSQVGPIIPEDPLVIAIAAGLKIHRADWGLIFSNVMARAQKTEAARAKEKTP